jgi:hypothetical protein
MTASTTIYSCAPQYFGNGTLDWDTDTLKMMLVSSSYTPSQTGHVALADVSAFEIANGNGYVTGGTTCAATVVRVGGTTTFNLADAVWVASGGPIPAWRYAIVYGSVTRNGVVSPLAVYGLGDITPADIPATADGATLRARINSNGLFTTP